MTIAEFLMNLSTLAGIVTITYAVVKKLLTDKANIDLSISVFGVINLAQLGSWVWAIILMMVANAFGFLGAGGYGWLKILLYGVYAGGVANAMWDLDLIRNIIIGFINKMLGKSDG